MLNIYPLLFHSFLRRNFGIDTIILILQMTQMRFFQCNFPEIVREPIFGSSCLSLEPILLTATIHTHAGDILCMIHFINFSTY